MTLSEIVAKIEAEDFQWAVCREEDGMRTAARRPWSQAFLATA